MNGIAQKDSGTALVDSRACISEGRKIGCRLFSHKRHGLIINERAKLEELFIEELTKLLGIRIRLGQFVILFHQQQCTVGSLIICRKSLEGNSRSLRSGGVVQVKPPIGWNLNWYSLVNAFIVILKSFHFERLDSSK